MDVNGNKTGGRLAGTPNKISTRTRNEILEALDIFGRDPELKSPINEGRVAAIARGMKERNGPMLALLGKILPRQFTGDDYEPMTVDVNAQVAVHAMTPEEREADYQRLLLELKSEKS